MKTMTRAQSRTQQKLNRGRLILSLVFVILSMLSLKQGYRSFWHSYVNRTHFIATIGDISDSGWYKHTEKGVSRIYYSINYAAKGHNYICSDDNGCCALSPFSNYSENIKEAIKANNKVTVYYDPDRPDESYLDVNTKPFAAGGFWLGLFLMITSLLCSRSWLIHRRENLKP